MLRTVLGRAAATGTAPQGARRVRDRPALPPQVLVGILRAVRTWGTGPAGGFAAPRGARPDQVGLIDELGSLTFGEMHRRSNALAWPGGAGVTEGDSVALMCRNHRGFVDASVAVAKLGADLLYLNTAFAGPQLVDVLDRERPAAVIHDEEFTELLSDADIKDRIVAWTDSDVGEDTLDALICGYPDHDLEPPGRHARIVILTSGTTGTPKGAPATRPASTPPSRCSPGCCCATAGARTSRPRSSTRGASRTSRSRCCSARRSCCADKLDPEDCPRSPSPSGASRWS